MATNNSSNQQFTNNSDGFDLSGGTTKRKLTVSGGDVSLAGSGSSTYTFPAATDTLVGRASTDTLTNKTIDGSQLVNTSVTASKLNLGPATASVATSENTTSTTYVSLATTTDAVTVTIGANGLAIVNISALIFSTGTIGDNYASFAVSGASTVAAADTRCVSNRNTAGITAGGSFLVTGLTAGSNTFSMKYRTSAGTANFLNRTISVIPL